MTSASIARRMEAVARPIVSGGILSALLVLLGLFAPRAVLHGWLIAFVSVGGIPLGATALLFIHHLTGGRWGTMARPVLECASACLPLLLLAWLPLLLGLGWAYPWAADPSTAGKGVPAIYLNATSVALRTVVGFVLLALLLRASRTARFGRLAAGLGLVVYALFIDLAAYDWVLSLEPRFSSSAFGAQIIVEQLLSALAFAVLLSKAPDDHPAWGDLGGLLLACTLGLAYLVLMSLIVNWYGDQPERAAWYLRRTEHGWVWLEGIGIAVGAVVPGIALLFGAVRDDGAPLRIVACFLLAGTVLDNLWLVAPATEPISGIFALVAVPALGTLLLGSRRRMAALWRRFDDER